MKNFFFRLLRYGIFLGLGLIIGFLLRHSKTTWRIIKEQFIETYIPFDDTRRGAWDSAFELVEMESSSDGHRQKAYFYPSSSNIPKPLVVSLHSWSGNYAQNDPVAQLCKEKNLNYIHPNFRGANETAKACCSSFALEDMDAAIDYALEHANVDSSNILVMGGSGGGYAAIGLFMKSRHSIKKFSSWIPITDLVAWYRESGIRNNKYVGDILKCTSSDQELNLTIAKERSPIFWPTPIEKLKQTELQIYTGIYDGIQGSVPITHSINFYNKVLKDLGVSDSSHYVSDQEKLQLLEFRQPLGDLGKIGDREICLKKSFKSLHLTIFEGKHEILTDVAFEQLLL